MRLAGLNVPVEPITTAEFGAAAPRPAYSVLDTAAYHRLGGPAMPDWKEALAEYFAELKHIEAMKDRGTHEYESEQNSVVPH